ncbi:hypothetical protein NHX12_026021 [Muraenolepis orangiensis]|uniref:Uncharacterized protein n=1 Tax=Muraenolepis orangiensis TaxID=630683 RepID=A0A9Q0EJK9_9TELE|nr:hypothetical protein NHX12_026021 [Muraenolepis orangiensis]
MERPRVAVHYVERSGGVKRETAEDWRRRWRSPGTEIRHGRRMSPRTREGSEKEGRDEVRRHEIDNSLERWETYWHGRRLSRRGTQ